MRLSDSRDDARKGRLERSVSRVLFLYFVAATQVTFIRLGLTLPPGSSSLPGSRTGRPLRIWPCTRWGIPGRPCCQGRRWSLTPPFRPYPSLLRGLPGFSIPLSLQFREWVWSGPEKGRHRVEVGLLAVCFLLRFPPRHRDRGLPGTVPCGARTFLRRRMPPANVWTSPTGERCIRLSA